jgi:hypothetical protein
MFIWDPDCDPRLTFTASVKSVCCLASISVFSFALQTKQRDGMRHHHSNSTYRFLQIVIQTLAFLNQ